ncbi:PucR family transcriptional regulator [Micromonospora sediminimaris]|uniref:PucR family transcriptional regulator n=1 Tax=Micromonospora sediminimaris TaxID=547162 RepID=UPI0037A230E0
MGDLFHQLSKQVDRNARRAVRVYQRELPEFRRVDVSSHGLAAMMDFAVLLRRRTAALAADEQPFTDDDLRHMESVGQERGERGISAGAQRQVLTLHSTLTLQEIREAAGPDDIEDVMRMLRWLGPQGAVAQAAYTRGFLAGQHRSVPFAARIQHLTLALLHDDPAAGQLAGDLALSHHGPYLVTVVTIRGDTRRLTAKVRARTIETLLQLRRTPMMWRKPSEFVLLTPVSEAVGTLVATEHQIALAVIRGLADTVGRPLSIGTAAGPTGSLAETADLARRVSCVAPAQARPDCLHTVADVLIELAIAQLPAVDRWLDDLTRRLSAGPDLVETLAAYYDNDMNRLRTAAALNIHPRTLDYRIRRAHELLGFHPATARGVRLIGAGIARARADRTQ